MWLKQKQQQILKLAIPCVLVLLSFILLLGIVKQWHTQPLSVDLSQANNASSTRPVQSLYWDWYNKGDDANIAQASATRELQEAQINAELMGVMIAQGVAMASIQVESKPEAVFHIGDELKPGVTIKEINSHRVVIDDRGRLGQLNIKKYSPLSLSRPQNSFVAVQESFTVADMFSATPVSGNNLAAGLKISSISPEIQQIAGLQVDDVIVEIGSYSVADVITDPSLWLEYSANPAVPVRIMREGKEVMVTVNAFSLSTQVLPSIAKELMPQ